MIISAQTFKERLNSSSLSLRVFTRQRLALKMQFLKLAKWQNLGFFGGDFFHIWEWFLPPCTFGFVRHNWEWFLDGWALLLLCPPIVTWKHCRSWQQGWESAYHDYHDDVDNVTETSPVEYNQQGGHFELFSAFWVPK